MLRGRLVCGINHERNQQHLLHEGSTLYLEKALEIALSLELAIYQTVCVFVGIHLPTCIVLHGYLSLGKTSGPTMKAAGSEVLL